MKTAAYICLALTAMWIGAGCSSDLDEVRAAETPTAPVLTAHDPIVFTSENIGDKTTFQWTAADFGYDAAVEYQLFGSVAGGTASRILAVNALNATILNSELNLWLQKAGVEPGKQAQVSLFLTALIAATHPSVNSAPVTVSITGYDSNLSIYEHIYMPGNHQGWNPATAPTLSPVDTKGNYEGMLALYTGGSAPEFKFTSAPNWDHGWGGTLAQLDPSGGNITELPEGFYRMQMSLPDLKVVATPITLIGVIGDISPESNWANDIPLVMHPENNYLWSVTGTFQAGEFKFRFNGSWDFNLGGSLDNLTKDGNNLRLAESGSYTITLNLSTLPYTATITAR